VLRSLGVFLAVVVLVVAAAAAVNGLVDPENEFYSGAPLTEALASRPHCVVADSAIGEASYPEFKQDLYRRLRPRTVVLGSSRALRIGPHRGETTFANLGYPGFGPGPLLDTLRRLADETPRRRRLTLYVGTDFAWFDPAAPVTRNRSDAERLGYLLDPRTLLRSLGRIRDSRGDAFGDGTTTRLGRTCVIERGPSYRNFRVDGTRVYSSELARDVPAAARPEPSAGGGRGFAWERLSLLDRALTIAEDRRWTVVGFATPDSAEAVRLYAAQLPGPWGAYRRQMPALFAKHGFPYLDWREARSVPCRDAAASHAAFPPNRRCSRRMRRLLDAAARKIGA
jgi:hypothetical protein